MVDRTCWICKGLGVKYTTGIGKRPRYFCNERHALEYQLKQTNKFIPKKYRFKNIEDMQKNPYFKKLYKKI